MTSKDGVDCDAKIKIPSISSDGGSIRIKGSSSRTFASKSFHLDFGASKVDGISKVALKAGEMDNSLVRELKTCELLYALGAPVYRSSYYQLFVNQVNFCFLVFFGGDDCSSCCRFLLESTSDWKRLMEPF